MNKLNIYITNSSVQNTGDVALLIATIQSIQKKIPSAKIIAEVSHPERVRSLEGLGDIELCPRILNIENLDNSNRLLVILRGGFDVFSFFICAVLQRSGLKKLSFVVIRPSRRSQAKLFSETNILLSAAGGYLNTRYTHYSMRLYMFILGLMWRKRVILFTQSIGPFETRTSRLLIPLVLNRVHAIAVREPASLEYLKQFKIKTPVTLTSDIAFLFSIGESSQSKTEKLVIFCVKQTNQPGNRPNYRKTIIAAIKHLISNGYKVEIVSHVHGDDALCKEIAKVTGCVAHTSSPDAYRFKKLYQRCSFIVSSRLHCIILASEFSVPFVAISYEPKFDGLASQLSYSPDLVLDESTVTDQILINAIDKLVQERAGLKTLLATKYDKLRQQAEKNLDWLITVSSTDSSNTFDSDFQIAEGG